ncbi:MAG: transposase [Bacteroidota bacterium]
MSESIRAFKSFSSRRINQLRKTPSQIWQSSFYNHVIRDENELNRIREYITDNPLRWELDNKNPKTFKHCKGTS